MKKFCLCLLLTAALTVSASALEVPTDTVVQNLNGSQQVVKTYTVAPGTDPQTLIEEPFQLEGFLYTYADIVKEEHAVNERQTRIETVTVETSKKTLDAVLAELSPTMEYDDGTWSGTLALDHTSLKTEAAGYTSGSKTVTETKTIGHHSEKRGDADPLQRGLAGHRHRYGGGRSGPVLLPGGGHLFGEIILQRGHRVRHHRQLCGRSNP